MRESSAGRHDSTLAPVDAVILAMAQIVQPATRQEICQTVRGSRTTKDLDEATFRRRFRLLEGGGFLWKTEADRFVVTPEGDALARRSMNGKTRDRIRLLLLNKRRHSS
jgi:hypothetical protein